MRSRTVSALFAVLCVWAPSGTLRADTYVWTNTLSANWSSSSAWLGQRAPPASGGIVEFQNLGAGVNVTATIDAAWGTVGNVNGLTFQAGTALSTDNGVYTLSGSGLTSFSIGAGGVQALDPAGTHFLNLPITLSANQTWNVYGGDALNGSATLGISDVVNGAAANTVLTKAGFGTLRVQGANGAFGNNVSQIVLRGPLSLLNGTTAGNNPDRIPDACKIVSEGGTFGVGRMMAGGTEDMGELAFNNGLAWILAQNQVDGTPSGTTYYRFTGLNPTVGAAAAFIYDMNTVASTTVRFQSVAGFPAANDGMAGGWAWYGNTTRRWLAPPVANANLASVSGSSKNNTTINSALATENVELITDTTFTLTDNRTFNSLIANNNPAASCTLNLGTYQLRLDTGGLANSYTTSGVTFTIQNGTLTVGAADNSGGTLYIAGGGGGLSATRATTFAATGLITDNGSGVVNLVKYNSEASTLTLLGNNSYSGFTAILTGSLVFPSDGAAGANAPLGKVPSSFMADNIRLAGGTLAPSAGITLNANRGIQLGGPGGSLGGTASTYNGAISGTGDLILASGWTLGGSSANTFQGRTIVNAINGITLAKTAGNAIPGDLCISCPNTAAGDRVAILNASDQIADTAVVTLLRPTGSNTGLAGLRLNGNSETIGGLVATQGAGTPNPSTYVDNNSTATASTLTIDTVADAYYRFGGLLRDGSTKALLLAKLGAGTQELLRGNTYTGGTTVNGGALLVSNTTGSGTGTGAISVGASGTLGGTGIVKPSGANAITVSGTVAPGASVGTLTIDLDTTSAGVAFATGAKLTYELGAPGTGDALVFYNFGTGDLTLNNNAVDVVDAGGLAPGTYTIMTFYSGAGTGLTDIGKPGSGLKIGAGLSAYGSTKIDYSQPGKINLVISRAAGTLISIR